MHKDSQQPRDSAKGIESAMWFLKSDDKMLFVSQGVITGLVCLKPWLFDFFPLSCYSLLWFKTDFPTRFSWSLS